MNTALSVVTLPRAGNLTKPPATAPEDMVFVFGSNLIGLHGAGAAWYAMNNRAFPHGLGSGPHGSCYAIPTKDQRIEPLPLHIVKLYVDQFIEYAAMLEGADVQFQVTRIGCGLAGFTDEQIAPLFRPAPVNCWFDEKWRPWLGDEPDTRYWGSF